MTRVVCIVQARLGSTRFPRKALADLGGKPVIVHVLERAAQIVGVHETVAAIPYADDELAAVIETSGFTVVKGPTYDVLDRYALVASRTAADVVVRITGDCPLFSPQIASDVLALHLGTPQCEYASNVTPGYVDGEDVEVFSAAILQRAHREATELHDREHVTSWIQNHARTIATLPPANPRPGVKTSIDTPEDLERVRALLVTA